MDPETLAAAGLRYDADGPVATITLDRPGRRNAQTPAMWRALADLGEAIPDEVRVVVVRGEGPSFSAGLDTAVLMGSDPDDPDSFPALLKLGDEQIAEVIEGYQRGFTFLADPRFVSIAAVQGHAIGAGLQLALACDLRVAAEDASFSMKEAALGLVPDLAGTKPLVEAVGAARALELCATTRTVEALEAAAIGLVNLVVPDLDQAVADLTAALLAPPAGAVREIKSLVQGAAERTLDEQRRHERQAQVRRLRELGGPT